MRCRLLLLILCSVVTPGAMLARAGEVTSFQEAMQGGTPAAGWSYLWNNSGPIGNPANYSPLGATMDAYLFYTTDGSLPLPRPMPGYYAFLGLLDPTYPDLSGYFGKPGGCPG